jgi:hypothetical protein
MNKGICGSTNEYEKLPESKTGDIILFILWIIIMGMITSLFTSLYFLIPPIFFY